MDICWGTRKGDVNGLLKCLSRWCSIIDAAACVRVELKRYQADLQGEVAPFNCGDTTAG